MTDVGLRTGGVVLAGGFSSRMGRCKALLEIAGSSALDRVVSSMRHADVEDLIVVSGFHHKEIEKEATGCGVRTVFNDRFEEGMLSSVKTGVKALPDDLDAFFLLPVDISLVRPATLREMKKSFSSKPGLEAVFPAFLGQRGHPPLIRGDLIPDILKWEGPMGLRGFLEQHEASSLTLETPDEGTVTEMDTVEEYHELRSLAIRRDVPTERECLAFWEILSTPQEVREHSRVVGEVAVRLARLVKDTVQVDPEDLKAAALLHDMARTLHHHADVAADMLELWGFAGTADLVRYHMELPEDEPLLSGRSLLYLADKLTSGSRAADLREKKKLIEEKFSSDPEALEAALLRLQRAEMIAGNFEKVSGKELEAALTDLDRERGVSYSNPFWASREIKPPRPRS